MTDEALPAMDEWGEQIASLDLATRKEILAGLDRLAGNWKLAKADRDFAQAQVNAIRKAIRRTGDRKRQSPKSRKK